jgi:hypothetical protein
MSLAVMEPMSSQTPHGQRHGSSEDHERERRRMEHAIRRLAVKRLNRDQPIPLRWLDFRWWQAKRCFSNPDESLGTTAPGQPETVYEWFRHLHWRTRGYLIEISKGMRQSRFKK